MRRAYSAKRSTFEKYVSPGIRGPCLVGMKATLESRPASSSWRDADRLAHALERAKSTWE